MLDAAGRGESISASSWCCGERLSDVCHQAGRSSIFTDVQMHLWMCLQWLFALALAQVRTTRSIMVCVSIPSFGLSADARRLKTRWEPAHGQRRNLPLDGVTVIDRGKSIRDLCHVLLARAGADVIKIEPLSGEPIRLRGAVSKGAAIPFAMLKQTSGT